MMVDGVRFRNDMRSFLSIYFLHNVKMVRSGSGNFGSLFAFSFSKKDWMPYARDKNIFKFFSKNIYKINLKCIFVLEYDHTPLI